MKVLAIDPGYDRLGIAIVEKASSKEKEVLLFSECFTTSKKDHIYQRLMQVGKRIKEIVEEYKPDSIALETLFITKNQKTAMHVSEARGIIIYEAVLKDIPVFEYSPPEIKIAVTGYGKSDKSQVISMIPKLITISKEIKLDDEYDAIAVGLTCIAHEFRSFPQKK